MVGTTIFGDQPDNMVRVEAKNLGVSIQLQTLKAESFLLTMKEVIEDQRYAALWVVVLQAKCRPDTGICVVCFPVKPVFCGMCYSMCGGLEGPSFLLLLIPILSVVLKDASAYGGMMVSSLQGVIMTFSYFG